MGFILSKFQRHRDAKILLLGLSAAKKLQVASRVFSLYKDLSIFQLQTSAFTFYKAEMGGRVVRIVDVDDDELSAVFWSCYFEGMNSIIYAINYCDKETLGDNLVKLKEIKDNRELPRDLTFLVVVENSEGTSACAEFMSNIGLILKGHAHRIVSIGETGYAEKESLGRGFEWLLQKMC
jgi:ADP-ribosylation factor family